MNRLMKTACFALIGLSLLIPAGCPTDTGSLSDPNDTQDQTGNPARNDTTSIPAVDTNDSQLKLLAQGEAIVKQDYPDAVLVEAVGTPAGEAALTAADIVNWEFHFMKDPDVPGASTVYLQYTGGEFGEPYAENFGLGDTMYQVLPRTMTLTTAVSYLRAGGYKAAFSEVRLRLPLIFPVPDEASYGFKFDTRYVMIGMETGDLTVD